jgi:hypothetical protein
MMRTRFALTTTLAVFAMHCSEAPAPAPPGEEADNHPGTLVITSPERAAFIEDDGSPIEIKGSGASSSLTINGTPAEVAPDGTFHATVEPAAGLNIVVAVDGEARLETPFLFGHFEAATKPVGQGIAIDIGEAGISGAAPAASLTSITNKFLEDIEIGGALKGQTFAGDGPLGSKWSYRVTNAGDDGARVGFGAESEGLGVDAAIEKFFVDGTLTIRYFGRESSGPAKISADKATIRGAAALSVEAGVLGAAMPTADVKLEGFRYQSNNAGFPCCVDGVVTTFLRPMIEKAVKDRVREEIPKALKITLDGVGMPESLELDALGLKAPLPIDTRFDGVDFDSSGGTLTASLLFGGRFGPGDPGARAPGWLKLGQPFRFGPRASSFGISFSVDAVNQLLFAAWGTGALSREMPDAPPVTGLTIDAALPPILSVTSGGEIRVALGELVMKASLANGPFKAAVSVTQDVTPSVEGNDLVLAPKGEPQLSITWLEADGVAEGLRSVIVAGAKDQMTKLLKPVKIPFPSIALDRLGPSFEGQSLGIATPQVDVDRSAGRLGISGVMSLVE